MQTSPIRKLGNMLVVNVPPNLVDSEVLALRRDALDYLRRNHCRWVLLDFSEVEVCDSFFGRFIHGMAEMVRLMGVSVVVCGLSDAVVETLVDMGFELPSIRAVLDLDDAIALSMTHA